MSAAVVLWATASFPVGRTVISVNRTVNGRPGDPWERAAMRLRPRSDITDIMRRIGLGDRIAEAQQILPEVVDLDRDEHLLTRLGLSLDRIVDELGGSAW
jgi:hypothetical protein